jgi:hypothetical protein
MTKNLKNTDVDPTNVQPVSKDQLKDADKAKFKTHMKRYEELCFASYGQTKSRVYKKNPLPMPQHITFSADPQGLQDMMNKAMHQTMIDQSKVLANTIQNCLTETLKKGTEEGYMRPTYFQPRRTPVFPKGQSASSLIDDPTAGIAPSPQINATAPGSLSYAQPIQSQKVGEMPKDPSTTVLIVQTYSSQSKVQDQTFSVQNHHQQYPAMRDQNGRLLGWGLPHDHFEIDISNFFEPQPEEISEVKYLESYQAMFGGTPGTVHMTKEGVEFVYFNHGSKAFERVKISPVHTHMVISMERKAPVPPQRPAPQPILEMPIQTTPLQQTTSVQPILTPANTVAHTRSSPQQSVNQGMTRQLVAQQQQVDPMQTMQMLLNQLASSGQLNLHQPTPSARQPIGHIPPVMSQSNTQGSSGAKAPIAPNPQPRTLEEQPPETPSAEMQAKE